MTNAAKHIPEIDGLRAIAVVAVILFHLQVPSLPGGFAGVDVFFVISGYLITLGLQRELDQTGSLRLPRFYMRRARRLMPALYVTLAISSACAVAWLSNHRLPQYGASQVAAALSLSNVHFFLGSGYFDSASDYKALLHTWSLGVEEQFYLLWPALLWLSWQGRQAWLWIVTAVLFAASLLASAYLQRNEPAATFFLVPFRFHEFMLGAALAIGHHHVKPTKIRADIGLLCGLSLIGYSVSKFDGQTPFPGIHALIPCLGAALVLWAAPASRFAWLLKNPLSTYLGRTSYSTYLMHWPLIVFFRVAGGREHLRPRDQAILFIVTLVLGDLLHRFIENRYRKPESTSDKRFLIGLVVSTAALISVGLAFQHAPWVEARAWAASHISAKEVEARRNARFRPRQDVCSAKGWDHCDDLVPGKVNAVVIGDSHSVDAYNAFVARFPQHNVTLSDLGGCPPHPHIDTIVLSGHPDLQKCLELNRKRHDPSFLRQHDYIILNVYMDWYNESHLAEYLRFLHAQGIKKVIVFGQTWRASDDLPELINKLGFDRDRIMPKLTPPPSDRLVKESAQRLGYLFIDKTEALSNRSGFELFDAREVLFTYDRHHLSLDHAQRLLDRRIDEVSDYLGSGTQPQR